MTPRDASRTTFTSAASMRVLAHPTRLRLLGLLRERGPLTAAQLGDVVDEAPGTISYHLGKLASIALIEPADLVDDPDKLAASSVLQKSIAQAYAARFTDYIDATPALPREWVAAAASGDRSLLLTVDELGTMRAELEALVNRWVDASAAHDLATADGAEPVVLVYQAYRRP